MTRKVPNQHIWTIRIMDNPWENYNDGVSLGQYVKFRCPIDGWLNLICAYAYGFTEASSWAGQFNANPSRIFPAAFAVGLSDPNCKFSLGFPPPTFPGLEVKSPYARDGLPFVGLTFTSTICHEWNRAVAPHGRYEKPVVAGIAGTIDRFNQPEYHDPAIFAHSGAIDLYQQDVHRLVERPRIYLSKPEVFVWTLGATATRFPRGALTLVFHDEPY